MKYVETLKNSERFCLHDSKISKIEFIDNKLLLNFSEGFYEAGDAKQKKICKLTYKFMIEEDVELNLSVFKETSKKKKEIKFIDFAEAVKKYGFKIYREFRCGFTTQIILEGNTPKGSYSILTQEIDEIIYEYDN